MPGSVINMYGGEITPGSAVSGQMLMYGGVVRYATSFGPESLVQIHGGTVEQSTIAGNVALYGGSIGGGGFLQRGARLTVAGGSLGPSNIAQDCDVLLFAGSIGERFALSGGSRLSIRATMAFLDGAPLAGLSPGATVIVPQRGNHVLSGQLADGSLFSFDLNDDARAWHSGQIDYIGGEATVSVSRVPEPTAGIVAAIVGVLAARRLSQSSI